jgi:hypothetical protein
MSTKGMTIAFFAALMALGPIASADGAPAGTPAERAAEIYKRANALYDAGKLEAAEKLYREAWQIAKTYDIAANLGAVAFDRGEYRDAAEYLSYAVASFPAGGKTAERIGIEKALKQAKERVCTLHVTVNVARAHVHLDGQPIGDAPLATEVFVNVGKRTLRVEADGYQPKSTTIDAKAGATEDVKLDLAPAPVPAVTATASATATVVALPPRSLVPAYAIGGVGVASLIAGGVLLGVGRAERADADASMPRDANNKPLCVRSADAGPELRPECPALRSKVAGAQALSNVGLPIMIAGGLVVAGAALYLLWPAPKAEPARAVSRVVPLVSTTGAGLMWMGSF